MSAVLSRTDMRTARSLVRWVGVGCQPKQSDADVLLQIVKPFDPTSTSEVRRVADEINRGVLASQEICLKAEAQLQKLYALSQDETD